jgi:hypothetical protein
MGCLQFHKGNFRQPKFMTFDLMVDWAEQVVSQNIAQFQPNYGTCSPLLQTNVRRNPANGPPQSAKFAPSSATCPLSPSASAARPSRGRRSPRRPPRS